MFYVHVKRYFILTLIVLFALASMQTGVTSSPALAQEAEEESYLIDQMEDQTFMVRLHLPDREALDLLLEMGIDLMEHLHHHDGEGYKVDAIVTQDELEYLQEKGYVEETILSTQQWLDRLEERERKMTQEQQLLSESDEVHILRADSFTNDQETFLYVEAKSSVGQLSGVILTATWDGQDTPVTLRRKVDAGQYMYHILLLPIEEVPSQVNIQSNQGGAETANVTEWLEDRPKPDNPSKHYVTDFIDYYMNPTEITERIEHLAAEFPELAEVVTLPNQTNGYRRHAQALLGTVTSNAIVVTSKEWGHEGGNDLSIEITAPLEANQSLEMTLHDQHIQIIPATDAEGNIISTAAEVIGEINTTLAGVVEATTYRGNAGQGVVVPQSSELTDSLSGPEDISRDPFEVKALRIGKHRDGSKLGVLAYSQEHAREWVTPLVTIETAERLLRNYAHDSDTRKLVDHLDIFLVPTVNPDGAHYSFYDNHLQRKNMTNHCDAESADPGRRNNWGVDLNRNHEVGSIYDGYSGASTNCLSATFAGPDILSEPEAQNLIWLVEENENIKFGMNIHSYGGYFMWSPGAYKYEGRETLERPTAGEEAFFWAASEHILSEIKDYRDTVILPGRTGPIPDVLYSAAGNSADTLWYNHDIFAWNFEVGADIWNPQQNRWVPVGFQPSFEEGHAEAMEFANGLIALFEVAYHYHKDKQPPKSSITPKQGTYEGQVEVSFETSEPATIYYTLDGSRPTFDSDKLGVSGLREEQETLLITETTTIKWFAVDAAGNIEKNYNPLGNGQNDHEARFVIE